MERERERERVGARVGDAQVLANRRDERFATLAVQPLGQVEHEIGTVERQLLREELVGLEADDGAKCTERLRHRGDGGWVVPLGERVVGVRGVFGGRQSRFFVVRETDSHVVSGNLLQKKDRG